MVGVSLSKRKLIDDVYQADNLVLERLAERDMWVRPLNYERAEVVDWRRARVYLEGQLRMS